MFAAAQLSGVKEAMSVMKSLTKTRLNKLGLFVCANAHIDDAEQGPSERVFA